MKGFWNRLALGCADDGATTLTMHTYGTFADTGSERLSACAESCWRGAIVWDH